MLSILQYLQGQEIFSLLHNAQTRSGAHTAFYTMGTGTVCQDRYADHTPVPSVEDKNDGAIPPPPTKYSRHGA
jgi:hypothetical protein